MKPCLDEIESNLTKVKTCLQQDTPSFEGFLQMQCWLDQIVFTIVQLEYKIQNKADQDAPSNLLRH